MFKYMLREDDFRKLVNEIEYEIDVLDGKLNVIEISKILDKLGFPPNWRDIIDMN